ncbi:MAG: YebC/PmpR family DNA-binding transcriptional regulator, partial [Desulfamplus sp.]|nr:YebC/PmpR family DNA-binding transcriptional regulator [Desulfamplus sp.]
FDKKGLISVDKANASEDTLMEIALEAGAEDVKDEGDCFEIITDPSDFETVKAAVDAAKIKYEAAEITMIPQTQTRVEGKDAEQMVKFMEALDDCDDIQKFYSNADIPDEVMNAM